ncbi:MAG: FkbM family methyltransferase [Clostridia bacterium]|nr:FkbM family methyltransferase [Clostridia bacterium]
MIKFALSLPCLTQSLKEEALPIFLYGMGNGAEKILAYLQSYGITVKGVVASDEFVRGQSFLGYNVEKISHAESVHGRLCLVVCFGLEGEKCRFLYELAKKHKIVSPNLPVFGEGVCNKEYIEANLEAFERVYSLLADDLSKEIFIQLIKYNITGDINYLLGNNGLCAPREFYSHRLRHIDIGAYDGDTATEYAQNSSTYADIVAFEPDSITYKKLLKNTADLRNIVAENAAVGDKDGFIAFNTGNGRASHCGEGDDKVKCVSIDGYCGYTHIKAQGTPVGSIKIDAEGMDTQAIYGGVNTIYVCKSHISVALYHRAGDYISIPLLLRKHNSNYKFYLRKKEYIPAWDVFLYAINN